MFFRHCIVKILANASAFTAFLPRIVAKTQHRKFFEPKINKTDCFSRRQVARILSYFKTDNAEKQLFYLFLASPGTIATASFVISRRRTKVLPSSSFLACLQFCVPKSFCRLCRQNDNIPCKTNGNLGFKIERTKTINIKKLFKNTSNCGLNRVLRCFYINM